MRELIGFAWTFLCFSCFAIDLETTNSRKCKHTLSDHTNRCQCSSLHISYVKIIPENINFQLHKTNSAYSSDTVPPSGICIKLTVKMIIVFLSFVTREINAVTNIVKILNCIMIQLFDTTNSITEKD